MGDFFCSADSLHPFQNFQRTVLADGTLVCRWVMPYRETAAVRLMNLGQAPVSLEVRSAVALWTWDSASMHFHARWRPDDVVSGTPFRDWNYIDIRGQGVFVGDAWTVLNIQGSWWGEGGDKTRFTNRLVFDMESSFGTDIRHPWNLLGYSAVTFWYAKPGATHNRPALPQAAARPILQLEEVRRMSAALQRAK